MNAWRIRVLNFGNMMFLKDTITPGLDTGVKIAIPFSAFLLDNGSKKILVDLGINEKYIVDGKGWGGLPAEGGSKYVLEALSKVGLTPSDIGTIVYTHLHNDHAGCCHLFKDAVHIFQEAEWENITNPTPREYFSKGYDFEIIPMLREMDCVRIEGDFELEPGIKLYKTPGHSLGGQSITVETEKGTYVITGDTVFLNCTLFPKKDKMMLVDGTELTITPYADLNAPAIPMGYPVISDYRAWYRSIYRLKLLVKGEEYLLTGHDPSIIGKVLPT